MIELVSYVAKISKPFAMLGICGAHTTSGNIRGGRFTSLLTKRALDASPHGGLQNYLVLACASNASRWAADMHEFKVTLKNGIAYVYADCYAYVWDTEQYVFYRGKAKEVMRYNGYDVVDVEMTPE